MIQKPNIDNKNIGAYGMIYIGYLIFATLIHVISISIPDANIAEVFNTWFIISMIIFIAMLIFGITYLVIFLFKWLAWYATTPNRLKMEQNNEKR